MPEADLIARTRSPVTTATLSHDLAAAGIAPGATVLVHCALSALGWVNGGAAAVVQALLDAVGPRGTVVMPSQSADLSDPDHWAAPPVPEDWRDPIRATMPAYDPRTTPTRGMGRVAELFRTWPGAARSAHPALSFSALGPGAQAILARQALDDPFGTDSPLGALYRLDAIILHLGVDFDTCTALHLAEGLAWPDRPRLRQGAPLVVDGVREWVVFDQPQVLDSDLFLPIGASALASGLVREFDIGEGRGAAVSMRRLVDHAADLWSRVPFPASPPSPTG